MIPRFTAALVIGLGAAMVASAALARPMLSVTEKVELAAPAAKTWEAVKNFDGLHTWHPAFASTEITKGENNRKGAIRVLTLKDGGAKLTEELLGWDDKRMMMKYRIIDSPLPITRYVSTIRVAPLKGGGSVVTWSSTFKGKSAKPKEGEDDASVKKLVSGVYTGGFENLKAMLSKQ